MKKGNILFISIILLCFLIVNVAAQFALNDGYNIERLTKAGSWAIIGRGEHSIWTRCTPVVLTTFFMLFILFCIRAENNEIRSKKNG